MSNSNQQETWSSAFKQAATQLKGMLILTAGIAVVTGGAMLWMLLFMERPHLMPHSGGTIMLLDPSSTERAQGTMPDAESMTPAGINTVPSGGNDV